MVQTIVVMPCYNEEKRINGEALGTFVRANPEIGFLMVNDGSQDGTLKILNELQQREAPAVEVLDLPRNSGKAEAVRQGFLNVLARHNCRFIAYWDADLATPLEQIPEFTAILAAHDEIQMVMGSRVQLLGRRIERQQKRHYLGRIFATCVSLVFGMRVYDTQCGAKMFRASDFIAQIFSEPFLSRWIFDVEILVRYKKANGSLQGIYEFPLPAWKDVGGSKIRSKDFFLAFKDLLKIYRRAKR